MPQVTLSTLNTNYNLLTLLYGASGVIGVNLNTQGKENCAELNIENDPGNTANNVLVGDGTLSATEFDVGPLAIGQSYKWGNAVHNTISLANKFLRSSVSGTKVNINIVYS